MSRRACFDGTRVHSSSSQRESGDTLHSTAIDSVLSRGTRWYSIPLLAYGVTTVMEGIQVRTAPDFVAAANSLREVVDQVERCQFLPAVEGGAQLARTLEAIAARLDRIDAQLTTMSRKMSVACVLLPCSFTCDSSETGLMGSPVVKQMVLFDWRTARRYGGTLFLLPCEALRRGSP